MTKQLGVEVQQRAVEATPDRPVPPRLANPVRHETRLTRLALVLISLHIADEAFVQTEPGTWAGDHLISGSVPILVLLAAGVFVPRLRAGARSVAALLLGAFGVVAGASEVGKVQIAGGLSGADYTGLLACVGGLVLLGVGTCLLWRTRRLDERRRRRYLRRSVIAAAAIVVGFAVVFPMLFVYGYNHVDTSCGTPERLGPADEEVTFRTRDGLVLSGSYLPSKNRAAVIVLPADGRCGSHDHAELLARHGYGVLMFDLRGTGDSEGDPYHWGAEKDVEAAVDFLRDRPDVDPERIGGLGLSLGGELMLQTAAETPSLRAVVSEGAGIRSIRESWDRPGPATWVSAPFWLTWTASSAVFTNQSPPPDLEDLMPMIAPRPVFLIYSGHPLGGEELNPELYEAAGEPKSLWGIGDAPHTGGLARHPEEYERRVVDFFDTALLAS